MIVTMTESNVEQKIICTNNKYVIDLLLVTYINKLHQKCQFTRI